MQYVLFWEVHWERGHGKRCNERTIIEVTLISILKNAGISPHIGPRIVMSSLLKTFQIAV